MIKIAVGGSEGKMGQRVLALLDADPRFEVTARLDVGRTEPDPLFDVMIDFSRPAGTLAFLERCLRHRAALVTGTTGLDPSQTEQLRRAAERIAVLQASNFSLGINLLLELLPEITRRLSNSFDIEIVETHHTRKVDAPSGTALSLLEAMLSASGRTAAEHVVHGRSGPVGAKPPYQIGVHAVRSGDVIGKHQVHFGGTGESIVITHEAHSRDTFAHGAIEAAAWIHGRPPGQYHIAAVVSGRD